MPSTSRRRPALKNPDQMLTAASSSTSPAPRRHLYILRQILRRSSHATMSHDDSATPEGEAAVRSRGHATVAEAHDQQHEGSAEATRAIIDVSMSAAPAQVQLPCAPPSPSHDTSSSPRPQGKSNDAAVNGGTIARIGKKAVANGTPSSSLFTLAAADGDLKQHDTGRFVCNGCKHWLDCTNCDLTNADDA